MPAVALPAVSILCTNSVPVPADSVTPLADHDDPGPTVASTQVVPPLALTWIFSPAPSAPVNVPLTVCDATLVMKSPAVPVSALSAVTVATALGGVAVDDEGLRVGGGVGVAGQVGDRDLEIVVGAGRQRGVERPVAANHGGRAEQRRPVKHLHAGNAGAASVGNRAGKVHPAIAGDEVGVRGAGVAGQRHRRERLARRCGVDDEGLRVGGGVGVAGQVGDRDLEIVVGAGRQRGVERPVAATTVAVPSSVAPLNTCTLAMPAPPVSATVPAKCTPPLLVMKSAFEAPVSLVSVTVGNVSLGGL